MGFGSGEGEHTSKAPDGIPADVFQQLVLQDVERSAVKRLLPISTRLCLAFGNWKLWRKKNFCHTHAFIHFLPLLIPITAIILHHSFLVKGY